MIRLIAALAIALVSIVPVARAKPVEVVIGVEELSYYPAYGSVDGEFVGAARDILDAFARDAGYRFVFRALPIKRLYQALLAGEIDAKFPDNPGWAPDVKKNAPVLYSAPVMAYLDGVMVPPANLGQGPESIGQLGTVSGFTPYAWLDRIRSGTVVVKENPRLDLLLRQTIMRRLGGAYVNVAVAHHALDTVLGMPGALAFDPSLPHSRESYRLSTTHMPKLIADFDAWLASHKAQVEDIKARFQAEKGVN